MKSDELLDAIGQAKDEYVLDAAKKPRRRKLLSSIAACLVLVLGINLLLGGLGGQAGGGGDSDLVYMNYMGPVLPLTIQGDAQGITASRSITFDFSPYRTYQESYENNGEIHTYDRYDSEALVTDSYVLENTSGQDQTVTLLYPFAGSMREVWQHPSLTVNGTAVSAQLHPGPYSGGFTGGWGSDQEGTINVQSLDSFAGYVELLSSGAYLDMAFDAFPSLDIPVVVYKLHDYVYSETTEDVNPTLSMDFYIDYEKTYVLSYNMNGASFNRDTGFCSRRISSIEYRPNVAPEFQYPEAGYVIVLGDDLEDYTIQGYRDGGCDPGEELNDLGCTVTRYETTLEEVMGQLLGIFMEESFRQLESQDMYQIVETVPMELYQGLSAELLMTYGFLGEMPVQRYDTGMLEDIFSGMYTDGRVLYLSTDVTIPQGACVTVAATMTRDGSIDYVGDDVGKEGYDMATMLGSKLQFTGQTASIAGFREIEIVGQNFGFDPDNGVTTVALDLTQAHYWMEVRKYKADG